MTRRSRFRSPLAALLLGLAISASASAAPVAAEQLTRYSGGSAAWSPDGSTLVVTAGDALEVIRMGEGRTRIGAGRIGFFGFPCECPLGWSADGRLVLFLSHDEEIEGDASAGSIAPDGSALELDPLGRPVGDVAWSPAGFPLAFVPNARASSGNGTRIGPNPDVWILDGLGTKPRKLFAERGVESGPLFSPDGSRILYQLSRGRSTSLRLVDADGSHRRVLVPDIYSEAEYSWSPDGSQVAVVTTSRHDRRAHLYVLPAADGKLRQLTREEVRKEPPAWSPDGSWIAFTTFGGAIREIRPDGSGAHILRALPGMEVRGLAWSPDGGRLAYSAEPIRHTD